MSSDRRFPDRWLGPGAPAAPGVYRLGLLPSGPDPIHETPPRRTRPSTPRARCKPDRRHARAGNSVPHIEDFGFRAPLAPHLARKEHCSPLAVLLRRRAGTMPGSGGRESAEAGRPPVSGPRRTVHDRKPVRLLARGRRALRRERDSNPRGSLHPLHAFQACALGQTMRSLQGDIV